MVKVTTKQHEYFDRVDTKYHAIYSNKITLCIDAPLLQVCINVRKGTFDKIMVIWSMVFGEHRTEPRRKHNKCLRQ